MTNQLAAQSSAATRGWAYRFFRSLTGRSTPHSGSKSSASPDGAHAAVSAAATARVRGMARQLISEDRYIFVLLREAVDDIGETEALPGWDALTENMALVPAGVVPVIGPNGSEMLVEIPAFYLDRYAVTNRQYLRFVEAGGYDNLEIWPQEVWPSLMKFTDQSRRPGPRHWENGRYPSGLGDHPVVGVCWYEAAAFAAWSGKRLPCAAEWQKAGGWPEHLSGGSCHRYPWGDVFDPKRANLWTSSRGHTVPVREYAAGATPNGIHQLTGNVWEWLADSLDAIPCHPEESFVAWRPMRRIVGGAFDTYFPAEATCQFVTGQPELDRRDNIGFRCAVSFSRLRPRV
ncbi:MAG: SUMF1/EgtB/PvdO family nonheme iron enzyme [Isosphaeraceae bacterium]